MGYAVFIGDVARDEYYQLDCFPALGEKVPMRALPAQLGGMIANAAAVYASYGGEVRFLSFLHPDDADLCAQLEELGIDTSLVQYDAALGPSKCVVYLSGEEHTVFISDMGRRAVEISAQTQEVLCGADVIYSNYWELQWLRCGALGPKELVCAWAEGGAKLMCDIDVDSAEDELYRQFVPHTHLLFLNKVGFERQRRGRSEHQTVQALHQAGLSCLVVTLADQGCRIYREGMPPLVIPAAETEVVDVTGAGDTFCSTLAWCYGRSGDLEKSARFATYAAARSISLLGARAGAVGPQPVLEFMRQRGLDGDGFAVFFKGTSS